MTGLRTAPIRATTSFLLFCQKAGPAEHKASSAGNARVPATSIGVTASFGTLSR